MGCFFVFSWKYLCRCCEMVLSELFNNNFKRFFLFKNPASQKNSVYDWGLAPRHQLYCIPSHDGLTALAKCVPPLWKASYAPVKYWCQADHGQNSQIKYGINWCGIMPNTYHVLIIILTLNILFILKSNKFFDVGIYRRPSWLIRQYLKVHGTKKSF